MSATSPRPDAAKARIWSFLVGLPGLASSAGFELRLVWVAIGRLLGRPETRSNPDAESAPEQPQQGVNCQPKYGRRGQCRHPGDEDGQDRLAAGRAADQPDSEQRPDRDVGGRD